jgi:hypothetical protein
MRCSFMPLTPHLQALWASAWLHEHSQVQQFEPRWTYLFESVYQENTVVVQSPFEGLVLLGAVSPEVSRTTMNHSLLN